MEATYVEEVHCVALHPSGTMLAAGFQDKLRLMTVLVDELKCVCREACMLCGRGSGRRMRCQRSALDHCRLIKIAGVPGMHGMGKELSALSQMSLASTHRAVNFPKYLSLYVGTRRQLKEFNIKGCREVRFSCGGAVFAAANGTSVHLYATYTCELLGVMRCAFGSFSSAISRSNEQMQGPIYCSLRVARRPCPAEDEVEVSGKI